MQDAIDAGVNWTYTSRCSGKLVASEWMAKSTLAQQLASASTASFTSAQTLAQQIASGSTTPSPIPQPVAPGSTAVGPVPQQIASAANNSVSTTAFNETATCRVSTDYDAILNSGTMRSTNSTLVNNLNDFRNDFVAAGISYDVTATNSLRMLATISGMSYPNHPPATNNLGLVNAITQDSVTLTYTRQIDPDLSVIGSIGAVGIANGSFSLALPSKIEPQYSVSVIWAVTPKVSLSAIGCANGQSSASRRRQCANYEIRCLTLNYQFSAKTTFSASVSTASATSVLSQPGGGLPTGVPPSALGSLNSYSAIAEFSLQYNAVPWSQSQLPVFQISASRSGDAAKSGPVKRELQPLLRAQLENHVC